MVYADFDLPIGSTDLRHDLRHGFASVAVAAGIKDLHCHDLRGIAVPMVAEAGSGTSVHPTLDEIVERRCLSGSFCKSV